MCPRSYLVTQHHSGWLDGASDLLVQFGFPFSSTPWEGLLWKRGKLGTKWDLVKYVCWSPSSSCGGSWVKGLWGMIRFRWGHQGGALIRRLRVLVRHVSNAIFLSREDRAEGIHLRRKNRAPTKNQVSWPLDLVLPSLWNQGKYVSVSHIWNKLKFKSLYYPT